MANNVFRRIPAGRLKSGDFIQKVIGGASQLIASEFFEAAAPTSSFSVIDSDKASSVGFVSFLALPNFNRLADKWHLVFLNTSFGESCTGVDIDGNAMTRIGLLPSTNGRELSAWLIYLSGANASSVITASFSGNVANSQIYRAQCNSLPVSPFDVAASGTSTASATVTTGAITTATADEVIFVLSSEEDAGDTWTPPSGFTQLQIDSGNVGILSYKLYNTIQTGISITTNGTTTSYSKRTLAVALKVNAGGGGSLTQSLSDSVTMSDSITDKQIEITKTDIVTLSDANSKDVQTNAADSVSLSDAISNEANIQPSDSITLSDSISEKQIVVNKTDSVTLSDANIKDVQTYAADSVSLNDVISKDANLLQADLVTLTDASSKDIQTNAADSVLLSDATSKDIQTTKFDTIILSDGITKEAGLNLADSITLSDSILKDFAKYIDEIVTLTDVLTADYGLSLILSDSLSLADAITSKNIALNVADTIILSDNLAKGIEKALADIVTLTDAQVKAYELLLNEAITLSDSLIKDATLSLDDSITLADEETGVAVGGYGGTLYKCIGGLLVLADLPDIYNNRVIMGKKLWYIKDGVKKLIHTASF